MADTRHTAHIRMHLEANRRIADNNRATALKYERELAEMQARIIYLERVIPGTRADADWLDRRADEMEALLRERANANPGTEDRAPDQPAAVPLAGHEGAPHREGGG